MKYVVLICAVPFWFSRIVDAIMAKQGRNELSVKDNIKASLYVLVFTAAFFAWPLIMQP